MTKQELADDILFCLKATQAFCSQAGAENEFSLDEEALNRAIENMSQDQLQNFHKEITESVLQSARKLKDNTIKMKQEILHVVERSEKRAEQNDLGLDFV